MKRVSSLILILLSALVVTTNSYAQEDNTVKQVVDNAALINQAAANSQLKINKIADQIDSKLQQFKALNKEIEGLNVYNAQLQKQINFQNQEMADLNAAIDEVSVIERQITPLMMNMIDGLEQFVTLDVPFLPEERNQRVTDLRAMMDRADVAPSEKFRRVMEAFQVEMDYGRTLEAYQGLHVIDGQERDVDFLRLGRTALIFQTRDAARQGVWNKQTRQWEELDSSYRPQITKGLRMAKKQLAPDLLMLPVAITD